MQSAASRHKIAQITQKRSFTIVDFNARKMNPKYFLRRLGLIQIFHIIWAWNERVAMTVIANDDDADASVQNHRHQRV